MKPWEVIATIVGSFVIVKTMEWSGAYMKYLGKKEAEKEFAERFMNDPRFIHQDGEDRVIVQLDGKQYYMKFEKIDN